MKVKIKKSKALKLVGLVGIIAIVALIVYFVDPFPKTRWNYFGNDFLFREDLKVANRVEVFPSCKLIFDAYNSPFLRNVTIYFKNDEPDYGLFQLETFELSFKMIIYNKANPAPRFVREEIHIDAVEWKLDEDPPGGPIDLGIFLVGPTSAQDNLVKLNNSIITISGRDLKELDYATIKSMMCMFGIQI